MLMWMRSWLDGCDAMHGMAYTDNWSLSALPVERGEIVDTKAKCFDVPALGLMERANLDWGVPQNGA
jgi:hypothetical protein